MKENKFRVWCKNKKEWETHSCFLSQNGTLFHVDNNMQLHPLNPETHIVEFFTGLKDSSVSEKEIYEGDKCITDEGYKCCVEWDEIEAGFYFIDPMDEKPMIDTMDASLTITVIGNKWDNPELLEKL